MTNISSHRYFFYCPDFDSNTSVGVHHSLLASATVLLLSHNTLKYNILQKYIVDDSTAVGYTVIASTKQPKGEMERILFVLHDQKFGMPIVSAKVGGYGSGFVYDIMACTQEPDELVSKQALCRLFECSGRTVQRMVARRDLPPPFTMAGREYWAAGTLGKCLADAAKRKQAEIEAEAKRLRAIMAERWRN